MKARWQNEKDAIERIKAAKAELEEVTREAERAERDADLERAAELRYGRIPELDSTVAEAEAQLRELHESGGSMLTEEVTEEDVAEVVAKWTGIPVSRLMEGEVEKLIHMEERLHERVIGQDEAIEAVAGALRRARAGLSTPTSRSAASSSAARPASARPSWPAPSRSSCSTPSRRWCGSTCPSTWRSTRSRG